MQPISYIKYSNFFVTLVKVCGDAGIEFNENEKKAFDACYYNPEVQKALKGQPHFTMESVVEKVRSLTENKLAIYEAARRCDLKLLADKFLTEWTEKLDIKVKKIGESQKIKPCLDMGFKSIHAAYRSGALSEPMDISAKIKKILKKMQWPLFENMRKAEILMCQKLSHPISKHIVYSKSHKSLGVVPIMPIPPYLHSLLGRPNPTAHEKYLIDLYSPLITDVPVKIDQQKISTDYTDDDVKCYLETFPEIQVLDLSVCFRLTPACFNHGHETITTIILNGTSLTETDIPVGLFPKLEKCIQEEFLKIINLNNGAVSDWSAFLKDIRSAEVILGDSVAIEELAYQFQNNPSMDGFEALVTIMNSYWKFENNPIDDDTADTILDSLLLVWKKTPSADWENADSLGRKIHDCLLNSETYIRANPYISVRSSVPKFLWQRLQEELTVGVRIKEKIFETEVAYLNLEDLYRLRYLIKSLRECNRVIDSNLTYRLGSLIHKQCIKLFFAQENEFNKLGNQNREVATFALMYEIYMELSYYDKNIPLSPMLLYNNPKTAIIKDIPPEYLLRSLSPSKEIIRRPGPLYHLAADHALACAFAMSPDMDNRAYLLRTLLANFSGYTSSSSDYPLAKIILGVVEPRDIPECDDDSPLKSRLLNYKGIMHEPIDDELKRKFLEKLYKGELGGKTKSLIDAMAAFYLKPETTEEQRKDVYNALKMLARISYDLSGDEVQQYANKTFNELSFDDL